MTKLDTARRGAMSEALLADLHTLVVGQDTAVDQIVEVFQMQLVGLQAEGRPLASFLFLGPTGTGKTRLVEALAQVVHGDRRRVLKIDCAEYQHGHEIAKLIGSPPGYLGHRETHAALDQKTLDGYQSTSNPVTLLLFDEIEKASDTLWNLLLGILDKAVLTLGDNTRVDFSRVMIFLTSNLGSREISNVLNPNLGFAPVGASTAGARITAVGEGAARKKFTPEFLNRIDRTVVFRQLDDKDLRAILELELSAVQARISVSALMSKNSPQFYISLTAGAKDQILADGFDVRYGARHLKRAIERKVMYPIVNLLTSHQICDGDIIKIQKDSDQLAFYRTAAV